MTYKLKLYRFIAEDGHVSIVNEFNPTSDEVKAWNALHKLVTLMESKMK